MSDTYLVLFGFIVGEVIASAVIVSIWCRIMGRMYAKHADAMIELYAKHDAELAALYTMPTRELEQYLAKLTTEMEGKDGQK